MEYVKSGKIGNNVFKIRLGIKKFHQLSYRDTNGKQPLKKARDF